MSRSMYAMSQPNADRGISDAAFYSQYGPVNEAGDMQIGNTISGMPFGEMPNDFLTAKWESTDDQDQSEYAYDNFSKRTLTDRRPDPATFAYEEPRQTIANSGFLNLIHYGSRGGEDPRHPEAFLDDTWGDPRGIALDPDFKQLAHQHDARMRFVRFSADDDHSITGLGVSEEQNIARLNEIKRIVAPRALFASSWDGKRNEMRRIYTYESDVQKVEKANQSYGDVIKDAALTPQRWNTILSNTDIRSTKMYHQFTTDHEFGVAKYGTDNRTRKYAQDIRPLEYTDTDSELSESVKTTVYRTLVANIAEAIRQKSQGQVSSDHGESKSSESGRKTAQMCRDLSQILYTQQATQGWGASDGAMCMKGPAPPQAGPSIADVVESDHVSPVVTALNSQIIRRGMKTCEDPLVIKEAVITDDAAPPMSNSNANLILKSGVKRSERHIGDIREDQDREGFIPQMTHVYRTVHGTPAFSYNGVETDASWKNSDQTIVTKSMLDEATGPRISDSCTTGEFGSNTWKERRMAPMGTKYMHKYTDGDPGMNNTVTDS